MVTALFDDQIIDNHGHTADAPDYGGHHITMHYAASLLTITAQTAPYALEVTGNALAPMIEDGAIVTIKPMLCRNAENAEPGAIALVALPSRETPEFFDRTGLYRMNADCDLIAGETTIHKDRYGLLGVE